MQGAQANCKAVALASLVPAAAAAAVSSLAPNAFVSTEQHCNVASMLEKLRFQVTGAFGEDERQAVAFC